jgi:hypothetical protein
MNIPRFRRTETARGLEQAALFGPKRLLPPLLIVDPSLTQRTLIPEGPEIHRCQAAKKSRTGNPVRR